VALSVQPRDAGGGGGKSSNEVVAELATEFATRMPPAMDIDEEAGSETWVFFLVLFPIYSSDFFYFFFSSSLLFFCWNCCFAHSLFFCFLISFMMRGEYMDSLGTALKQESVRDNGIIVKMESTLIDIQRAIRGELLMSAELDEQYTVRKYIPDIGRYYFYLYANLYF
jgi:hypothetical protein